MTVAKSKSEALELAKELVGLESVKIFATDVDELEVDCQDSYPDPDEDPRGDNWEPSDVEIYGAGC